MQDLSFQELKDIKRHAKGLLLAIEKSNRKEFLDYQVIGDKRNVEKFCEELIKVLDLRFDFEKEYYHTAWGKKTKEGVKETIKTLITENPF